MESKIVVFILIAAFWLIKTVLKAKKAKEEEANSLSPSVSSAVARDAFDREMELAVDTLREDMSYSNTVVDDREEAMIDRALEMNNGDLLSSVDYINQTNDDAELHNRRDLTEAGRFMGFGLKKKKGNKYAKMLSTHSGKRNAVVLSEIFSRKF